jgi:hypothetical protein
MFEKKLSAKEIKLFIEEQKENVPISSLFWKVKIYPDKETTNNFGFISKPHYTNTIRPVNFYKPILSIINFDEEKNI